MSDMIFVQRDDGEPTATRVHERFHHRGYHWAVTESLSGFNTYRVTHIPTGTAVPFSSGDTPKEAQEAFFDRIDQYDDEKLSRMISQVDPVMQIKECPRCDGKGHIEIEANALEGGGESS